MNERLEKARFPHWCRIYRKTEIDPYTDDEETSESVETIYEGKCRKYSAKTMRIYKQQNVIKEDYAVNIPEFIEGVQGGCHIDVEDECGKLEGVPISNLQPIRYGIDRKTGEFRVGTSIYFNSPDN